MKKQAGFTLIETMVAVGMSAILLLGIAELMNSNQQTSVASRVVVSMSNDTRYIFDTLGRDIRLSGFRYITSFPGFAGVSINGATVVSTDQFLASAAPISVFPGSSPPTTNRTLAGLVASEDILITRGISTGYLALATNITSGFSGPIPFGAITSNTTDSVVVNGVIAQGHAIPATPVIASVLQLGGGADSQRLLNQNSLGVLINSTDAEPFSVGAGTVTAFTSGVCNPTPVTIATGEVVKSTCFQIPSINRVASSVPFSAGSRIHTSSYRLYYICSYDATITCGGTPAIANGLAVYTGNPALPPQVIVQNVEVFRLLVGVGASGAIDTFQSSSVAIPSSQQVQAVRVLFILRGERFFRVGVNPSIHNPNLGANFGTITIDNALITTPTVDLLRRFEFTMQRRQL
ncbi:MAG: prepilin-type N-terminal cleavage/methylation domain-containing protein [Methylacidiphilales bacterium]|nr:prepilin-type N-terminal cleavage/methylation domain-containing protein [Candidatus Methylacidiphilales bacterium]